MKARTLLTLTAIASSLLGALVVWLVLSVPNDLQADALLKDARRHLAEGKGDEARAALTKIVQQYPRTDAAAAATVALVSLADRQYDDLARVVIAIRRQNDQQTKLITDLQKSVAEIRSAPPKVAVVTAPASKPPPKKAPAKKPAPRRRR